jgi:mRNA interferase MazF
MSYVPNRSDLIWLNFDPRVGHEQSGRRPALVMSPSYYNNRANLALVCPITSRVKGYPYEVVLPSGLSVSGVILADHLRSVDWQARNAVFIAQASVEIVDEVLSKLDTLINP